MLRVDGNFTIFKIQHEVVSNTNLSGIDPVTGCVDIVPANNGWHGTNMDVFGYPEGFNASGKCWQETGVHGVYTLKEAKAGLKWISSKNPAYTFRLIKVAITQRTEIV